MSELKVHKIGDLCFDFKMGKDVGIDFYLKSDVDAVIAELKKENEYVIENTAKVINAQEREIRHQKYKRCLAMAEMCKARYDAEDAKNNWCGLSWVYISKEMKYWERWHERWLKLAEKFKDKETM